MKKMKIIDIFWYLIFGVGLLSTPYLVYSGFMSISEGIFFGVLFLVLILVVRYLEKVKKNSPE
jgi:hypothetical protein